jgi:hypothetical protein
VIAVKQQARQREEIDVAQRAPAVFREKREPVTRAILGAKDEIHPSWPFDEQSLSVAVKHRDLVKLGSDDFILATIAARS